MLRFISILLINYASVNVSVLLSIKTCTFLNIFVSISNQFNIESFIIKDIYNLCTIFAYNYFAGMQTDSGLDRCRKERFMREGMQEKRDVEHEE